MKMDMLIKKSPSFKLYQDHQKREIKNIKEYRSRKKNENKSNLDQKKTVKEEKTQIKKDIVSPNEKDLSAKEKISTKRLKKNIP